MTILPVQKNGYKNIDHRLKLKYLYDSNYQGNSLQGIDVIQGLNQTPKSLPPQYFYDDKGSELFEEICGLPEYYLTRTETQIIANYAHEIADITGKCEIIELGSGSSTKTRIILDAYAEKKLPLHYLPVDVSAGILESSAKQLLLDYPTLYVDALVGTYEEALSHLPIKSLPNRMMMFIGSTLGNLNPEKCHIFLSQIQAALAEDEYFLLGVDLQKPQYTLEAAYNDSQGVTAAFNLNMLAHLNYQFDGNFDLDNFEHWAFYNQEKSQIEMHLRSKLTQTVQLRKLNLQVNFARDETLHTEISRKFDLNQIQMTLMGHGLKTTQVWTDEKGWFALILAQAKK